MPIEKPQTYHEEQLLQLINSSEIRAEFAGQILKNIQRTQQATKKNISSIEHPPEQRLSFAEAKKSLDKFFNLEAVCSRTVNAHERWGIIDGLINMGKISNVKQYRDLLQQITVSQTDLATVIKMYEKNLCPAILFDPGLLTPAQLYQILFTDIGVTNEDNKAANIQELTTLRAISPAEFRNLHTLHKKSPEQQLTIFQNAYKKAPPLKIQSPRLIFTPNRSWITRLNTSPIQELQSMKKGQVKLLDPCADFLRIRDQMDAGLDQISHILKTGNLKNLNKTAYQNFLAKAFELELIDEYTPNADSATTYPHFIFPDGHSPSLIFDTNNLTRQFLLTRRAPSSSSDHEGARIALG